MQYALNRIHKRMRKQYTPCTKSTEKHRTIHRPQTTEPQGCARLFLILQLHGFYEDPERRTLVGIEGLKQPAAAAGAMSSAEGLGLPRGSRRPGRTHTPTSWA